MTRSEMLLHVALILLIAVIAGLLPPSGIDDSISAAYFDAASHRFPLRDDWFFRAVLHDAMHDLLLVIAVAMLALLAGNAWVPARMRPGRTELAYVLLVFIAGTALVGLLKDVAPIYCPWSLADFGADRPHYTLGTWLAGAVPASAFPGHCWPSSHAGGAFALLGIYFAARSRAQPAAGLLFAGIMAFGALLGWAQVARGAHFTSHVLWAMAICWAVALACHPLLTLARRRA